MGLFQRIFFAVLLAGLISGAAMAALQQWRVAPLIVAAEALRDRGARGRGAYAHEAGAPAHDHGGDEWAPQDGFERTAYTVAADVFVALGFAFVLAAASVLTGLPVTARQWRALGSRGICRIPACAGLRAATGAAGDAGGRSGAAPDLVVGHGARHGHGDLWHGAVPQSRRRWRSAIVLVLAPHVIGAPQVEGEHASGVPAHLAAAFASTTLFSGAVFWLILGPLYGYLVERFSRAPAGVVVAA